MLSTLTKGTNMKRFIASLIFLLMPAIAIAGNYAGVPLTSGPVETSQLRPELNTLVNNVNTNSTGLLYGMPASVTATAAATTQTLATYTLPANYLANVGQSIRFKGYFSTAANANSKTPIITFGTFTLTGTALTGAGAQTATYECVVTKTGASTQTVVCSGLTVVTPVAMTYTAGTSTDTATIAITGQCTQGSASADCTLNDFTVESLR